MSELDSMLLDTRLKYDMWIEIADDPQELKDKNKTKVEALMLANFFEGKYDGLSTAKHIMESSKK